jgi:hypothetical protein
LAGILLFQVLVAANKLMIDFLSKQCGLVWSGGHVRMKMLPSGSQRLLRPTPGHQSLLVLLNSQHKKQTIAHLGHLTTALYQQLWIMDPHTPPWSLAHTLYCTSQVAAFSFVHIHHLYEYEGWNAIAVQPDASNTHLATVRAAYRHCFSRPVAAVKP